MLIEIFKKLSEGNDLTENEAMAVMRGIMEGKASQSQIGAFITAFHMKGETIEEITGCARVMREKSLKVKHDIEFCIDTCGTGGDKLNTFNISTTAAIIAASGGAYIAKHGNRSVSSRSGSADVLEKLGVNLNITPEQTAECIKKCNIGFMFAPGYHSSMKYAAGPRKELGIRSIFNILGPLTNPANANGQVLGVFDKNLVKPLAYVLSNLGIKKALVVNGSHNMDEISTTGESFIAELDNKKVRTYTVKPELYGIKRAGIEELEGGDANENAVIILDILKGKKGARRDIAVLNAAASLYVAGRAGSIKEGVKYANELIDSKKALNKLREFAECTNSF